MRTRFAPSPTGSLHVGNARIAVLNWLLARRHDGAFIVRIEDTDIERNAPGAEEEILRDLRWLGLDWDEGPDGTGGHGPYRQSERLDTYAQAARRLVERGAAYRCFCTDAEIADRRQSALARGEAPHYDGRCAELTAEESADRLTKGDSHTIRFRVPRETEVAFHDPVRGALRFQTSEIGDFVLLRSGGLPTYNFAVVVDDIGMEITHVIRGSGHLSNTPRQQLLYDAFATPAPVFVHVPMVLGPDRQKLSKRHGARALSEYREEGYLPDAIVNYLSLLSWSSASGDELLARERLIAEISLERMGAADVVFDPAKLSWLSSKHIELLSLEVVVERVRSRLEGPAADLSDEALFEAVDAIRSRLSAFGEINAHMAEFFPGGDATLADDARPVLRAAIETLSQIDVWKRKSIDDAIRRVGSETGRRGAALYQPLRIALTGREHGPALGAVLVVQGREAVLATLREGASKPGVG